MSKYPIEQTKDVLSGQELHHYWLEDIRKLFWLMLDKFGNIDNFPYWQTGRSYAVGTVIWYKKNQYYQCILAINNSTPSQEPPNPTYWISVDPTNNPELMPWCAGKWEDVMFINPSTGLGAPAANDPRKFECTQSSYPYGYDSGKYFDFFGNGDKPYWYPGQNPNTGKSTTPCDFTVNPMQAVPGYTGGTYDIPGPCVWFNGDWASPYSVTAQTETTITVSYDSNRDTDFQVGMPIRLTGTTSVDPENPGTNDGVYRIKSFVVEGSDVVITLADQDDKDTTIRTDLPLGEINCDFGGDYYSCGGYWYWGDPEAVGPFVNSRKAIPPRGGQWSASKIVYSHRGVESGWVRAYIPSKYHKWDENGERYFCDTPIIKGRYAVTDSDPFRDARYVGVVVPLKNLLPRQTDPKEQVPPVKYTDSGRISWRYGEKVEIRRSIFTDVDSLRPDYGSVERVEVDINSGNNYGRCFAGNYTHHWRSSVGGGTGHLYERWLPYFGAEWKVFKAEGTSTGTVSTSPPEELRHKSINEDRSYQNMIMWLVSHLEEKIMIEVDDLFKLNFINWINAVNGTSYTVEDYDITDSKFPSVAPSNHSCWGCNGSGFELLLKKIGSYDWYFDTSVPWNPVELLDYRIARNTPRRMKIIDEVRTLVPHWRPVASLIRQWESNPHLGGSGHVGVYDEGVICTYGGNYYRAKHTHQNTATFDPSNWTQIANPYNNPNFRLIGEDDWYMPKNKGSWRRTWKYSLGRIPGVVYWPHDRKGVPAGDTQYYAGPASGGGTTSAYPAGQTIDGVTYCWPFPYPTEWDTWDQYIARDVYNAGPYGMRALYPFPYADTGNISSFNAGIKNPTTNLFEPYDQEHLDAIRESIANYRGIEVLITTDEFEVTESIYNVLKVGWRIHLHKLNDSAEHAEVLVIRKRTSGSSYYIKVHDLRETPAHPLSYFNRCYFDSDICARHDADWVSIVDGELVEGFSVKPEMIVDMREIFNHMDQVEYPCEVRMHIHNASFMDDWWQNSAHFVFGKPELLGATGWDPYAAEPYIMYNEELFKNYLKQLENQIIETRLSHELPLLSGELTIPEWQPGTYNTGQKVVRYGLIATARRDGVTSDPWNEYFEWFLNPDQVDLKDWYWVYTPGEWYDPGPYPPDSVLPKVWFISKVDPSGVINQSSSTRVVRVFAIKRRLSFYRAIRYWQERTEDYTLLSAHWYYYMEGGFENWGFAAVYFNNMPPKFDGRTVKCDVYACCWGWNKRPIWEQDDPITYPPIADSYLRDADIATENSVVDLGNALLLPGAMNSGHWFFHDTYTDPETGEQTDWLKDGLVKKIPITLTSQNGKAYIPFFIKPSFDYETSDPGGITAQWETVPQVRPSIYHTCTDPHNPHADFRQHYMQHQLEQNILIGVDSNAKPIISPDLFNIDFDQFQRDLVRCIIKPYDPKTDAIPPQPNPGFLLIAAIYDANVPSSYYGIWDELVDNNLYIKGVAGRAEDYEGNAVYYEWRLVEADGTVFKTFTDTTTNSMLSSYNTLWDELNASTITQLNELYLQVRTKDSAGNKGKWSEPKQITGNIIVPLKGAFTVQPSFTGTDLISCTAKVSYGWGPTKYQIGYVDPINGEVVMLTGWQSSNVFTNVEYTSQNAYIAVRARSNGVIGNWGLSSSRL